MNFHWNAIWGFLANQVLPVLFAVSFIGASAFLIVNLAQPSSDEGTANDFREAANQTRWPNPRFVSTSLVEFKFDHPVTVVAFTQALSLPKFKEPEAYKDVWVTEVPYMKAFCQEYIRLDGADRQQLALRLKERLGLPPQWRLRHVRRTEGGPKGHQRQVDPSLWRFVARYQHLPASHTSCGFRSVVKPSRKHGFPGMDAEKLLFDLRNREAVSVDCARL